MSYYNLVETAHTRSLTVFDPNDNMRPRTIASSHPHFDDALAAVRDGDIPRAIDCIDTEQYVARQLRPLSERVMVSDGNVLFDGEILDNSLTQTILRFLHRGEDFQPLVAFFEKVMTNVSEYVREQLYAWIADRHLTITRDGNIVAYKGVRRGQEGGFFSINQGYAIVDGREHNGAIPNDIGSTVEMPRSSVTDDPAVGCSYGLHCGTWEYASTFGRDAVLTVEVNPRDVVSVPTDCSAQKIRVCRYKVRDITTQQLNDIVVDPSSEAGPLDPIEEDDLEDEDPFEGDDDESLVDDDAPQASLSDSSPFYNHFSPYQVSQWNRYLNEAINSVAPKVGQVRQELGSYMTPMKLLRLAAERINDVINAESSGHVHHESVREIRSAARDERGTTFTFFSNDGQNRTAVWFDPPALRYAVFLASQPQRQPRYGGYDYDD